jgi:predicted flap endonuclease-1-like 5' DNA nuclease
VGRRAKGPNGGRFGDVQDCRPADPEPSIAARSVSLPLSYAGSGTEERDVRVMEIEGVGERYAAKLQDAGIATDTDLLEQGRTRKGREEIADATGLAASLVLEWVNHADLMRIHGVGPEYADLLEEAGVDTVPELGQRNAANLHAAIESTVSQKGLVRRPPSEDMLAGWIAEARTLGRTIEY